ncbi:allophanate hydrolase subunit 1 [Oryzobacter telluris]|uniref:5-oxoprolinase subunit B family protein n=1 Tax=Oryzobacter telluris TaxID=3149179 RepID=UPI00370D0772
MSTSGDAGSGLTVEVLPVGAGGLLLEVADLEAVLVLASALRAAAAEGAGPWSSVTDVVPAARTVLLATTEGADLAALRASVLALCDSVRVGYGSGPADGSGTAPKSHEVEVPVVYDGPDLDDVAARTGLTRAEVVAAHTGTPWRVAFGGFAPGFAYLVGGDPRLVVPRRASPRASVPAGSVGLAGEFSGVYPRASPGGWQLLGTTDVVLWDADRDPPALLAPGSTVRFVAVEAAS